MFLELVGTLVVGLVTSIFVWALKRALGRRLPGWLVPVAAGLAMLATTISNEYGWYDRTAGLMPEGFEVAQTVEATAIYRPWTYLRPYITRFVVVDQLSARTHPDHPGQRMVDLVLYGRWARTAKVPVLYDCVEGRRADLMDGLELDAKGTVEEAAWRDVPDSDPVLQTICKEA